MDADRAREEAERDQLWASLRALRPHLDRLAAGGLDPAGSVDPQLVVVLARVVTAELDYRARDDEPAAG